MNILLGGVKENWALIQCGKSIGTPQFVIFKRANTNLTHSKSEVNARVIEYLMLFTGLYHLKKCRLSGTAQTI